MRHPLMECGLDKAAVRALAKGWGLPTWDKPAMACLSSRVPYGEAITPEKLRQIDRAEYKRQQAAPGLKVSTKAFGSGRRIPIAQVPGT